MATSKIKAVVVDSSGLTHFIEGADIYRFEDGYVHLYGEGGNGNGNNSGIFYRPISIVFVKDDV